MKVNKRIVATFRQLDTGWAKHKQTKKHFVQTKSPQMIKKKVRKKEMKSSPSRGISSLPKINPAGADNLPNTRRNTLSKYSMLRNHSVYIYIQQQHQLRPCFLKGDCAIYTAHL